MAKAERYFVRYFITVQESDALGDRKEISRIVVTVPFSGEAQKQGLLRRAAVVTKYNESLDAETFGSEITADDVEIEVETVESYLVELEREAADLAC